MPNDALALLEELANLALAPGAPVYPPHQEISDLAGKLAAVEPFRVLEEGWLRLPGGGGRTGAGHSLLWVWTQLQRGTSPAAILQRAGHDITSNGYDALEVRGVRGIEVSGVIPLLEGFELRPNSDLPPSVFHGLVFGHEALGHRFPTNTAALVVATRVEPAIVEGHDSLPATEDAGAPGRRTFARHLRYALGLVAGGPVEMPHTYDVVPGDCFFASEGGSMRGGGNDIPLGGRVVLADVEAVLQIMQQIQNMKSAEAIELSVDRLLKSRVDRGLEDKIIDLGMAAEIALMHRPTGSGDGKGEITNKISTRGAWLIGETAEERLAVARDLKALYNTRSVVVHTGKASGTVANKIKDFDELVTRICLALLDRGEFPDWNGLVLDAH